MAYATRLGRLLRGRVEDLLESPEVLAMRGAVQLIFTSPPFPLNRKKRYGNEQGQAYVEWLAGLAPRLAALLTPNGSVVLEIGNAWQPGSPEMSTLPIEALLAFRERGGLKLCQQFVCANPARLPGPAAWVTVDRIRVKDSFTHVWWMAPTVRPKADNRRVRTPYSPAMLRLLASGRYNSGMRPSQHNVGERSFLRDNGGAIPPNVLSFANTVSNDRYLRYCREHDLERHPARMQPQLAQFFIKMLTDPGDLVLDPFAGSNTTGAAAEDLDRRWVGFEIEEKYIRGSIGRFDKGALGMPYAAPS